MDDEFAETDEAVAGTHAEGGCDWISLKETVPNCEVYNSVDPADLHQGALGDCWLISALASLAEYPDVVQGLIEETDDGYTVSLYHFEGGSFEPIEINDKVPGQGGQPMFVKPTREGEIWPCLIEKAFAKMSGGYGQLKGGWPIFAFGAMKGCTDLALYKQPDDGGDYSCIVPTFSENTLKSGVSWESGGDDLSEDDMFAALLGFNSSEYLMAAGSNSGSDSDTSGEGVVQGHAYSILDVQDGPGGSDFKLLQLRNPWSHGEWTGAWSDGAPEWDQNPDVRDALNPTSANDGCFWMPWEDFQAQYKAIYVAKTSRESPAGRPPPACAACTVM